MDEHLKPEFSSHPIDADYVISEKLGEGAFAIVKLGCDNDGNKVAVKIVDRSNLSKKNELCLFREIKILKSLDHPNIVKLLNFYESVGEYCLALEYMDGGELFDRIVQKEVYNEEEARNVVRLIVRAIHYCHQKKVVHRDLKPENLLLLSKDDDCSLKIADFGLAIEDQGNSIKGFAGSPLYMAPEIIRKLSYGLSVDMWAIGVISFILVGGYPPFYHDEQSKLFELICEANFEFESEFWGNVSENAKDFIRRLIVVDVNDRMTAEEASNHPWIADISNLRMNDLTNSFKRLKTFNVERKRWKSTKNLMSAVFAFSGGLNSWKSLSSRSMDSSRALNSSPQNSTRNIEDQSAEAAEIDDVAVIITSPAGTTVNQVYSVSTQKPPNVTMGDKYEKYNCHCIVM